MNKNSDEYWYSVIRKNVKKIRLEKGLTQAQLGILTDLSREYVTDIENEKRNKHFTIAVLGRLSLALEIDIKEFSNEN